MSYRLEVALLENQHQGQVVSSPEVVATYRLPWRIKVGKRQPRQRVAVASASDVVPCQNDPGYPSRQQAIVVDTPSPRPRARNELGGPTQETLIPSSPASLSVSEGEHQGAPCVPTSNTRAPVARHVHWVAGSRQRKRGRTEVALDDGDSYNVTEKRPRLERRNNDPIGATGPSAPTANYSRLRPMTTAAGITPHAVSSSDGSPPASATPSAPRPRPSSRPVQAQAQAHQSPAQPTELNTTVLRAAHPRCGPVSGGPEIWLEMEDLPTTFTLYAIFGDRVAATVSSAFHPFSQCSFNFHI